jgi:hypothetical protein
LFGIDDPNDLDEDQRMEWAQELQNKRDEAEADEPTDEQWDEWRDACQQELQNALDEIDIG